MKYFIIIFIITVFGFNVLAKTKPKQNLHTSNYAIVRQSIGDNGCLLQPETDRIQAAFVVDNTFTNRDFISLLSSAVVATMNTLNTFHRGTEFALTTHANWEQGVFKQGHTDPEGCYVRRQVFTNDTEEIRKAAAEVTFVRGPDTGSSEENGISALAFAAADERLGWIRAPTDSAGRSIHRFLILMTDEWSIFSLPKPGDRKPFRGDGSDTCTTSLPPSLEKAMEVMLEKDMNVIGAYFKKQATYEKYKSEFLRVGLSDRHCTAEKVYGSAGDFGNGIQNLTVNCVMQFLDCVYADPPPYNTLGL